MLPDFDSDGDLPPGIHTASVAEIKARFATFRTSDVRLRLLATLDRLLEMARVSGIVNRIVVGGSYVTANPEPNDIDVVILLSPEIELSQLTPQQYNVARRTALRRVLKGADLDVIVARDGSSQAEKAVEFFQTNRDNKSVGVVEVSL